RSDELGYHGIESLRRHSRRNGAGREGMPVAADGSYAGNSLAPQKRENLSALVTVSRPIVIDQLRVTIVRPRQPKPFRQILKVDAPIEHAHRITPEFPRRFGGAQPFQKPGLLFSAEHRLRRRVPARI